MKKQVQLGPRFSNALMYAAEAHADQERKGSGVPYVSHLLAVAGLALEHGADEDVAIAALLHDVAEDQGGIERLARVSQRFGSRVAAIVVECSDAFQEPKPAWQPRKEAHLARLREASLDARLVVAADKIHNARSIAADHRAVGEAIWDRFNASREQALWYYRAVADVLCMRGGNRIFSELNLEVTRLERLGEIRAKVEPFKPEQLEKFARLTMEALTKNTALPPK